MLKLYAVVMAGGSGTRFWPASRKSCPKQLQPIGPTEEPLIRATVRRLRPICPPERILIATGENLLEATRAALPELPSSSFIGEPEPRNTAPCIGWATGLIRRTDPDATIMVVPSDHHIEDEAGYLSTIERAVRSAESGTITTIGIHPTRPETGYGYLELGAEVAPGIHTAHRFIEKPDRFHAEQYATSGRHVWNAGMFFFRADQMLAAIGEHLPQLSEGLTRIERAAAQGAEAERAETSSVFAGLKAVSIDYGVMERLARLNVVSGSFGWSDLGSWESAWELASKDGAGNAGTETTVFVDAQGNLVRQLGSRRKVVALLGVEDLCIIETDDALLVMPRERAQDVRSVVVELGRRGLDDKV
jgi:mannose-1-phosphate guanylyltransferase